MHLVLIFMFFFSSRRRHTRLVRDWSSDVCSSDLLRAENFYRYQIMLRLGKMSVLSRHLALIDAQLTLPDDVTLTIDIDPVNFS